MMENDREAFAQLVAGVYETYQSKIEFAGLQFWWSMLEAYDLNLVHSAFMDFARSSEHRHRCPKPGDILDILKRTNRTEDKPPTREIKRSDPKTAHQACSELFAKLGRRRGSEVNV